MTESSNKSRFLARFSEPKTQPSLFHYIKEKPDPGVFEDFDWSFLRHPIRSLVEAWKAPRTKPSLFHYVEEEPKTPFSFREFLSDLFTGFKNPIFIPSVFSNSDEWDIERAQGRTRRLEAGMLSVIVHVVIIGLAYLVYQAAEAPPAPEKDNVVFVQNPITLPYEGTGEDGGGGGGGGKNQPMPPATGRIPEISRTMVAPDPDNPQPLTPAEDLLAQVQMPIEIPQDMSLPIGDISAPPNNSMSSGSGSGGGIGTGQGTGIGPGTGAGVGPGSGGGMGGGEGGGIGSGKGPWIVGSDGVKAPVILVKPLPAYTEEARKARAEGIVLIQAVIRKDGTVDNIKVVRGLGYGLDESAINTIATKWRFRPGTRNGEAVDVQANIEVSFRLY